VPIPQIEVQVSAAGREVKPQKMIRIN